MSLKEFYESCEGFHVVSEDLQEIAFAARLLGLTELSNKLKFSIKLLEFNIEKLKKWQTEDLNDQVEAVQQNSAAVLSAAIAGAELANKS